MPVGVFIATAPEKISYEQMMVKGFKPQQYKSKPVDPADLVTLRTYLLENNLRTATQRDLVYHLTLECFQNVHSKSYVKKLVYCLSKDFFSYDK